jgi:hypothetical protein
MELETGKLNTYYIDRHAKKYLPYCYRINATETEFKELLENYISENQSQDGKNFSPFKFLIYGKNNGYIIARID